MRGQPRHDIGYFLRTHWPAKDIRAPIGHAQIRPSNDNRCAQGLIADQSQIGWIDHRSAFGTSAAIFAVALCAIGLVRIRAALWVAGYGALRAGIRDTVWRKSHVLEIFRLAPARSRSLNQYVNLF